MGSLISESSSSSSFVVEVLDDQGFEDNPIAIVLTAAHTFYSPNSKQPNGKAWLFTFKINPSKLYQDTLYKII